MNQPWPFPSEVFRDKPVAFLVEQTRNGKHVSFVGGVHVTKELAEQTCKDAYRADWDRTGIVTPTAHYAVVPNNCGVALK